MPRLYYGPGRYQLFNNTPDSYRRIKGTYHAWGVRLGRDQLEARRRIITDLYPKHDKWVDTDLSSAKPLTSSQLNYGAILASDRPKASKGPRYGEDSECAIMWKADSNAFSVGYYLNGVQHHISMVVTLVGDAVKAKEIVGKTNGMVRYLLRRYARKYTLVAVPADFILNIQHFVQKYQQRLIYKALINQCKNTK